MGIDDQNDGSKPVDNLPAASEPPVVNAPDVVASEPPAVNVEPVVEPPVVEAPVENVEPVAEEHPKADLENLDDVCTKALSIGDEDEVEIPEPATEEDVTLNEEDVPEALVVNKTGNKKALLLLVLLLVIGGAGGGYFYLETMDTSPAPRITMNRPLSPLNKSAMSPLQRAAQEKAQLDQKSKIVISSPLAKRDNVPVIQVKAPSQVQENTIAKAELVPQPSKVALLDVNKPKTDVDPVKEVALKTGEVKIETPKVVEVKKEPTVPVAPVVVSNEDAEIDSLTKDLLGDAADIKTVKSESATAPVKEDLISKAFQPGSFEEQDKRKAEALAKAMEEAKAAKIAAELAAEKAKAEALLKAEADKKAAIEFAKANDFKLDPVPEGEETNITSGGEDSKLASISAAELAIVQSAEILKTLDDTSASGVDNGDEVKDTAAESAKGKKVTDILAESANIRPLPDSYVVINKRTDMDSIDARLKGARSALAQGRYGTALELFNDLYISYSDDSRVLMGRAVAMQRLKQNSAALAAYEEVLSVDPKNLSALTNMLGILRTQDKDSALSNLIQLRNVYPYNPDITAQLGMVYGAVGDYKNSIKYLDMADALKPGNSGVLYNRAVAYDRMGKSRKAAELYIKLINLAMDSEMDGGLPIESIKRRLASIR